MRDLMQRRLVKAVFVMSKIMAIGDYIDRPTKSPSRSSGPRRPQIFWKKSNEHAPRWDNG